MSSDTASLENFTMCVCVSVCVCSQKGKAVIKDILYKVTLLRIKLFVVQLVRCYKSTG